MRLLREWWSRHRGLALVAVAHVVLGAVLAVLAWGDDVTVMGAARWVKPIKFCISVAVYTATLAWMAPVLGSARWRRWPLGIIASTMAIEIVLVTWQASRGVRSHFNMGALFDGVLFGVMGIAIAVNTVALAWCAVLAWRGWRSTPDGYRLGVVLGMVLALLASGVGGLMIRQMAHAVGVPDGGPGLPFLNWSTTGGDLRIAHFVGLHALQGLPLLGWRWGARVAWGAAGAWVVVTALLLSQAMAGVPLVRAAP